LSNRGSTAIKVKLQAPKPPFSQQSSSEFTLPPGGGRRGSGRAVVGVAFAPKTPGVFQGTLTITSDDPARPSFSIALAGSSPQPALEVAPASIDFGEVEVGVTASRPVTLTNRGSKELHITVPARRRGTAFSAQPSGALTLAPSGKPGALRQLVITFAPTHAGSQSDSLRIASDDPGRPAAAVSLAGRGRERALSISPERIDFGQVAI